MSESPKVQPSSTAIVVSSVNNDNTTSPNWFGNGISKQQAESHEPAFGSSNSNFDFSTVFGASPAFSMSGCPPSFGCSFPQSQSTKPFFSTNVFGPPCPPPLEYYTNSMPMDIHGQPAPFFPSSFISKPTQPSSIFSDDISPSSKSKPSLHVCESCGHTSLWSPEKQWGSRGMPYTPTLSQEPTRLFTPTSMLHLISISAMPFYQHKSHEELRWEDYQAIQGNHKKKKSTVVMRVSQPNRLFSLIIKVLSVPAAAIAILIIALLIQSYFKEF